MNVIRQPRRGGGSGPRPFAVGASKPKGRGRGGGALDFDIIQYRPGPRQSISTSSDGEVRTPSNLQLQMAISSSAQRTSSTSIRTSSGNNFSSSSSFDMGLLQRGNQILERLPSTTTTSSAFVTPRLKVMGPPKTPSSKFFTPKNSITPRTTPTSTSTGCDQINSHVVLAVTEGRGHARGEVGIAVIDVKRPKLILCQLSDRQTYANALTKISVFQPVEILIPNTFVDSNQPNKLYNLLEEKFPHVSMTKVQRRLFRDSDGLEKVQSLCLPENSSCQLIIQDRFYALAAAAALLKYVEFIQNVIFAAHSLKVEYQGAHHGTIIDVKTAKNLELLLNQQSNNASHTLVGLMDHCATHGGSRLLRASLLYPPCSLPSITRRQDGVQELVENPEIGKKIREVLQQLPDVEQLLTLCMQTPSTMDSTQAIETRMNYVLMLKTTLEALPLLAAALEKAGSFLLSKATECLRDPRIDSMKARILRTLNEDVKAPKGGKTATFQKCFAVKSGINDFMDVARKTYCELISDMHEHVTELGNEHSLSMKMNYSVTKGYHIQITFQKHHIIKKSDLPPIFAQVQQSRNSLSCTTDTLIHVNERIKQVTTDILSLSNTLLAVVLNDIREHISYLYEMCESIAEIDLLLALSQISSCHNYVRPQFGNHLSLKASRHPILESITSCDPIANDIEATSWKNLSIVTGANMSGKSTYIRQVLLLQIMAQVGSYVPAEEATFRITDRIFSHLNFDDSLENNASTLALEMQEMQLALSSLTATSLVALDELCRGTSVEEGTALAWALCEELSQSAAFVFVTTHFRELTKLESMYPSVKNVYLETVEQKFSDNKDRLVYTHRLLPGINPVEGYGLRLAETLDVPGPILHTAKVIASQIKNSTEINLTSGSGDEAYCLSYAFNKLKNVETMDDLLTVQSDLKEALTELHLERRKTDKNKKMSPLSPPLESERLHRPTSQNQKLCEYSSSEPSNTPNLTTSLHKSRNRTDETLMLVSVQKSAKTSPPITNHTDNPHSSSHHNMSSQISYADTDHDAMSTSTSILESTSYDDRAESPRSLGSFCSQNTWRVESPFGQLNQTNGSVSRKRIRSHSNSSDSDFDERSTPNSSLVCDDSNCSSTCFEGNNSTEVKEMDRSKNLYLLSPEAPEKVAEVSFQNAGQNITDFFKTNVRSGLARVDFFSFRTKEPRDEPTFEDCFRSIANTNQKKATISEMSLSDASVRSVRSEPTILQKCAESPKDCNKWDQIEKCEPDPIERSSSSIRVNANKDATNALEALMVSYCHSDSDSD